MAKGKGKRSRAERKAQRQQAQAQASSSLAESATKCNASSKDTLKEFAAQLLAEDHITDTDIAETVGVDRATLWRWKQEPEFQATVAEIQKQILNLSRRYLIARKSYRLGNLQRRLLAMEQVIRERGANPAMQKAAGGKTGLLVRRQRMIGSGENAVLIEEFEFDAALAKEMREHEKQAAQEVGDLVHKVAPTSPDGKDEYIGISAPDLDEFRKLPIGERIKFLRAPLRIPPAYREESPPAV